MNCRPTETRFLSSCKMSLAVVACSLGLNACGKQADQPLPPHTSPHLMTLRDTRGEGVRTADLRLSERLVAPEAGWM